MDSLDETDIKQLFILDFIVGNPDRKASNFIVGNGKLFAIDHGLSFNPPDASRLNNNYSVLKEIRLNRRREFYRIKPKIQASDLEPIRNLLNNTTLMQNLIGLFGESSTALLKERANMLLDTNGEALLE